MAVSPSPRRALLLTALLGVGSGCNKYEYFNLAGYEQAGFSDKADILFVIDNSSSMQDESAAMGTNFAVFIQTLTDTTTGADQVTEDLSDAVGNYLNYTAARGRFIDYRIGITTTTMDYAGNGASADIDPGEAGTLVGDVVVKGESDVLEGFQQNLMCDATCWSEASVPSDDGYSCGDPIEGSISYEALECLCAPTDWADQDHCGSGNEEHLESALMALCRSVEDPPDVCFGYGNDVPTVIESEVEDGGSYKKNGDFLREDSTILVVFVTDEGDNSRRLDNGEDDPSVYLDAFEDFDRSIRFVAIGPPWNQETKEFTCNSGNATADATERLQTMASETGGFYRDISQEGASGDCEVADFAEYLRDLGELLANLSSSFQLQSIPDITTIRVWVNNEEVPQAQLTAEVGDAATVGCDVQAEYCNGWTYDSAQNSVVFWDPSIPDYNADVRIYYRPLSGKPRELPF